MALNKYALIRYKYLDDMLSDRNHHYTRTDLKEKCNERLIRDFDGKITGVSKRTIEMDINALQEAPFYMDIIEDTESISGKRIVRYADQSQSLFSKPMTADEKRLLHEVLNTLGQFSGLNNFTWLDDLQNKLNDKKSFGRGYYNMDDGMNDKIISFSSNEFLKRYDADEYINNKRSSLGWFFYAIANKKVVSLVYRKFNSSDPVHFVVYPYHLKQYNDRWYLICNHNGTEEYPYNPDFLMNLPLDRIESYKEVAGIDYIDCPIDINERFQDVVGITYHTDRELQKILFCVAPETSPYIDTKPLHNSQKKLMPSEQEKMQQQYPKFKDWTFYTIECIPDDYELPRLLMSYGSKLVVLAPRKIVGNINSLLLDMLDSYKST